MSQTFLLPLCKYIMHDICVKFHDYRNNSNKVMMGETLSPSPPNSCSVDVANSRSSKLHKGRTIIFSPGGIAIGKKIVCMRKNAEINCLLQRCIWKKLSAETTYAMQDLGNFKKNCLHSRSGGKKLASAQSMMEKISCLPEITIPPGEK